MRSVSLWALIRSHATCFTSPSWTVYFWKLDNRLYVWVFACGSEFDSISLSTVGEMVNALAHSPAMLMCVLSVSINIIALAVTCGVWRSAVSPTWSKGLSYSLSLAWGYPGRLPCWLSISLQTRVSRGNTAVAASITAKLHGHAPWPVPKTLGLQPNQAKQSDHFFDFYKLTFYSAECTLCTAI